MLRLRKSQHKKYVESDDRNQFLVLFNTVLFLSFVCVSHANAQNYPNLSSALYILLLDDVSTGTSPAIKLEKYTNSEDADNLPGPNILKKDTVTWTFEVTNIGNSVLEDIVVSDELILPIKSNTTEICTIKHLDVGETQTCNKTGIAIEGQHKNKAKVRVGNYPIALVYDEDVSHYFGEPVLKALPKAVPQSGDVPLKVRFTPYVNSDSAIHKYEWDLDGDGMIDRTENVGSDQIYTYATPGIYEAVLRITDSNGKQATGTVTITANNKPPEVIADVEPSNGPSPLAVLFTAKATDTDGIAQYEWDFDGDGVFDQTTTIESTTFTYDTQGFYQAVVRVSDSLGAQATVTVPTLKIQVQAPGSPTAQLIASGAGQPGFTPLKVNLTARASAPTGLTIDTYEWDFDGDGTYDQTTTSTIGGKWVINKTYTTTGTFYPRLRVTASDGQQAEDVTRVFMKPKVKLSLPTDTIDPDAGESVDIEIELNGTTQTSVVIETTSGSLVKTLLDFTELDKGTYSYSWDGFDTNGITVSEGEYRAILLYKVDGQVQRYDRALLDRADTYDPREPPNMPGRFYPLAGEPAIINLGLNRASEVTSFMGQWRANKRFITFHQRQPLGRGSHSIVWNGENSDGQMIQLPLGERFLFGSFAYPLPYNAIFVRSAVHVSNLSLSPALYIPDQINSDGSTNLSQLTFMLNGAGDVRLIVSEAESGFTVLGRKINNLVKGLNTITWDGRDNNGDLVSSGVYRIGVAGVDESGFETITIYALQEVFY